MMPQSMQTISACGKCILVGEHAVVYGAKAIAIPLPSLRISVTLFKEKELRPAQSSKMPTQIKEIVPLVVGEACTLLHVERPHVAFDGNSNIPVGAGLGSSAALCVASIRALDAFYQLNLSAERIAALANVLEARFHGNPSGLDATVVSYESCLVFSKGVTPEHLALAKASPVLHFILVDSIERSSTKEMVDRAAPHFQGTEGSKLVAEFDAVTTAAGNALQARSESDLAKAMAQSRRLLEQVGVVTPAMQNVMREMERLGVIGVKPTGAGGGGMILGLAPAAEADHIWHQVTQSFDVKNCFRTIM